MGGGGVATGWYTFRYPREYWMIYRGPGFLAVVWFGSSLSPPIPSASCRTFSGFLCVAVRAYWGGGGVAKSYDRKKAWAFVNHSILSDIPSLSSPSSPNTPIPINKYFWTNVNNVILRREVDNIYFNDVKMCNFFQFCRDRLFSGIETALTVCVMAGLGIQHYLLGPGKILRPVSSLL